MGDDEALDGGRDDVEEMNLDMPSARAHDRASKLGGGRSRESIPKYVDTKA